MRTIACARCGAEKPRRGSYSFRGADYCESCANELRAAPDSSDEEFSALQDPTVCAFCGADGGEAEYALQMGLPACPSCETRLYRAPLPRWVVGFLAGVAAVLLVCGAFELPYYRAFVDTKRAVAAMKRGDVALSAERMAAAAATLPDDRDLASGAALLGALAATASGDLPAARERYQAYLALEPDDADARLQLRRIDSSLAFDARDWRRFYDINAAIAKDGGKDPMVSLALASAAACLWAAYGEVDRRSEAESLMAEALAAATDENRAAVEAYVRRTRYRLDTREILSPEDYYLRHPEEKQP
jgi:tetratricopeptide (TPR) repeat protein